MQQIRVHGISGLCFFYVNAPAFEVQFVLYIPMQRFFSLVVREIK